MRLFLCFIVLHADLPLLIFTAEINYIKKIKRNNIKKKEERIRHGKQNIHVYILTLLNVSN